MSVPYFLRLLARRWWLIVLVPAVATGATLVYSYRETPRYEGSVSVYAHPASAVSPTDRLNELNLLSYGSVLQTLANIAESPLMMRQIAWDLPLGSHGVDSYAVVARLQPQTTEIYLSVDGPNSQNVRQMTERLPDLLNAATTSNFAVVSLTRLDGGAATRQVQPKTLQNALFGGLAGLIAGFVIAAVSAQLGDGRARSVDGNASPNAPSGGHPASGS